MNRIQVIEEVTRLRTEREKYLSEKIADPKLSKDDRRKFKSQKKSILQNFINESLFKMRNKKTWEANMLNKLENKSL